MYLGHQAVLMGMLQRVLVKYEMVLGSSVGMRVGVQIANPET